MNETVSVLHAPKQHFRHEWKHQINFCDSVIIRQRLQTIAKPDSHALRGKYRIRSLYFDNLYDKALLDKINGINYREKFRIRFYNNDVSFIRLEKKSKTNSLCTKESAPLTEKETRLILKGDLTWMHHSSYPLVHELYSKIHSQGLIPKTIVDYIRIPFIYEPGNVRITLDYDIRTGLAAEGFLDLDCLMIPAGDRMMILEVKWDACLPDIIRDVIQLRDRRVTAFSKYAQCRIYG